MKLFRGKKVSPRLHAPEYFGAKHKQFNEAEIIEYAIYSCACDYYAFCNTEQNGSFTHLLHPDNAKQCWMKIEAAWDSLTVGDRTKAKLHLKQAREAFLRGNPFKSQLDKVVERENNKTSGSRGGKWSKLPSDNEQLLNEIVQEYKDVKLERPYEKDITSIKRAISNIIDKYKVTRSAISKRIKIEEIKQATININ